MWDQWFRSYPDLRLLDLDVGRGQAESRKIFHTGTLTHILMPHDERVLQAGLQRLLDADAVSAGALIIREAGAGALLPDIYLMAGAFHLAEGNFEEAIRMLSRCHHVSPEPGLATRRIMPSLRLLLRITPCVLLPLYPGAYAADLLYSVALWRNGAGGEALEIIRDMVSNWGLHDELRVVAGVIHLEQGSYDRAVKALSVGEETERDAMELSRAMYLAWAHYHREEYRSGARALIGALRLVSDVNPHLLVRARQMLAELYERNGMLLHALRESGRCRPGDMPGDVAAEVLAREERWVTELGMLTIPEIERLGRADDYQVYVPDEVKRKAAYSSLDTSRDPSRNLTPKEMSWVKRRQEEREINAYRAAVARGETVSAPGSSGLSEAGLDIKLRIEKAERWWPSRRQALMEARPNQRLAIDAADQAGHLRFDLCGGRRAPTELLTGEKRARLLYSLAGASLLIFLVLLLLQTCVY